MELPPNAGHPAIILWDVSRGQLLAQLPQTGTQVYDLAVTADGHRVIAAYLDGDVVDWTTDASTALNQVCKLAGRPFRTPRAGVGQTFGFDWTRHGLQLLFAILGIGALSGVYARKT